ncbi:DUF6031 family protein [Piscinibacter terrae]|uniref:Uncharacterized protein n=1 Tax=Piscinibacter terrae TaxID=2496871 RepID=A0A3N7HI81_9BURK|nr:DUF6031 family protein [Albitalea terrae]RQP21747.1 hypothetical protein DZC73_25210 [Albitalea terrae]
MQLHSEVPPAICWFPRLGAGYQFRSTTHVKAIVTAAWLLMTELYAYLEDLEGAREQSEVAALVRVKIAELLLQVDCVLCGADLPDEMHRLPLLMQYGLGDVAALDGPAAIEALGLDRVMDAAEVQRLTDTMTALIRAFPLELVDALKPENQGRLLRFLRFANKACEKVGCDAGFLAPLMRSL